MSPAHDIACTSARINIERLISVLAINISLKPRGSKAEFPVDVLLAPEIDREAALLMGELTRSIDGIAKPIVSTLVCTRDE